MSNKSAIIMLKEVSQHLTQRRKNLISEMRSDATDLYLLWARGSGKTSFRESYFFEILRLDREIKEIGKCILKLRGDKWSI